MPHFVHRSNAHRRFHQRNLQRQNNITSNDICNICTFIFLSILVCILFQEKILRQTLLSYIIILYFIFICGILCICSFIIRESNRITNFSNELSDIESDNEDTVVEAEIVDADAEVLQLEYLEPQELYNTEYLTTAVMANPIEN